MESEIKSCSLTAPLSFSILRLVVESLPTRAEGEFRDKTPNGFGRCLWNTGVQYHGEVGARGGARVGGFRGRGDGEEGKRGRPLAPS